MNNINNIKINTDYIKLDSFLKFCGIAQTGGMAKEMIIYGDISVNGEICEHRGKKLVDGDTVEYDGQIFKVVSA